MKIENCSCGNVVAGSVKPSVYRNFLKDLLKNGGIKAVVNIAVALIPGMSVLKTASIFFLERKYGNDLEKLIDKIVDGFETEQVYVFICPKCGKSWTKKYESIQPEPIKIDSFEKISSFSEKGKNFLKKSNESISDMYRKHIPKLKFGSNEKKE